MNIDQLAAKYHVRLLRRTKIRIPERAQKDWTTEHYPSIPGRYGFIRAGTVPATDKPTGMMILVYVSEHPSARRFMTAYRTCKAAGMTAHQRGDVEGSFIFDPGDELQARTALQAIRARKSRKRVLTPEQREALLERLTASKISPP